MIKSRVSSRTQTTIPRPVRDAFRLQGGDELAYIVDGDRVIVTRADAMSVDDPFRTFEEWDSDADRRAYADLSAR